jgi:Domain of unknown function (DUF4160)
LRFYFHSHEPNEPPHIHVDKGDATAKFWLDRPTLVRNYGFTAREVNELYRMVNESRQRFIEAWHDYFGTDR